MTGHPGARQQLRELTERHNHAPKLGCSLVSHRDLGFCAGCVTPDGQDTELAAWRLLAMAERGVPDQPRGGS